MLPLTIWLAGCAAGTAPPAPATAPAVVAPSPGAPASPAAAAAVPRLAREARVLDGVARYFARPLADARVEAHPFGTRESLAAAIAGPDGTFRVVLPEGVRPGQVIELVATAGQRRVASVAPVPTARTLLQDHGRLVLLDEARTIALMIHGARLLEAIRLDEAASIEAALDELEATADQVVPIAPEDFDRAVAQVFDPIGELIFDGGAQAAIADLARALPDEPPNAVPAEAPTVPSAASPAGADGAERSAPEPVAPVVELVTPAEGAFDQPAGPIAGGAR